MSQDEVGEERQGVGATGLTRAQVAARLGVHVSSVRRMEGTDLHPWLDGDGKHLFDPSEVEALRAHRRIALSTGGELAARAFSLFRNGRHFADVVIELRQPPATVRQLYAEWRAGYTAPKTEGDGQGAAVAIDCDRPSRDEEDSTLKHWRQELERGWARGRTDAIGLDRTVARRRADRRKRLFRG